MKRANSLDDVSCILTLSPRGMRSLINPLRSASGIVVNFVYSFSGVLQQADGTYTDKILAFQVAGHIGGQETRNYPELYLDSSGNPIF